MVYFLTILITLLLTFLDISLVHYFQLLGATPFITLAFIVALTVRTNNYVQISVAFLAGILFDFASSGHIGEYTIIFLLTILVGRILIYRKTSYATINSFVALLTISTVSIYALQVPVLISNNYLGWQNFIRITLIGLILTLAFGVIIYKISSGYFNWFQKKTEKY